MRHRTRFLFLAVLVFAAHAAAELKTYTADADQSSVALRERRIYRGDCDPGAATPNAGDDEPLANDQCTCTPGANCAAGSVPAPLICSGGSRAQLNCVTNSDCPASTCAAGITLESCGVAEGRPNGGACDPSIPFPGAGSCSPDFPTHGSPRPGCTLTTVGSVAIDDTGNGIPTLVRLSVVATIDDFIGGAAFSGIPGSTLQLHQEMTLGPTPNQTGSGSTTSSIDWGVLTGWSQTGRLTCTTHCPAGCGAASGCKSLVGFEGVGPVSPLISNSFSTDPWVFTGNAFRSDSFQYSVTNFGVLQDFVQIGGRLIAVPALPLTALGGLGAGLVYLGARALGRKRH